jgi:hypothetical protein
MEYDELWKVYWWGGHRDDALVRALGLEDRLQDIAGLEIQGKSPRDMGRGFEVVRLGTQRPTKGLPKYLPISQFHRYSPINSRALLPVPTTLYRLGKTDLYTGTRILVKRGITEKANANGRIIARLAHEPFSFRNSIHGIRLRSMADDPAKVLLAIMWSSLARYYFWMTIGSWGMWHHEITEEALKRLPVRFPTDTTRIVSIVNALLSSMSASGHTAARRGRGSGRRQQESLDFGSQVNDDDGLLRQRDLEASLDDAVFDLYELTQAERDLIVDMCEVGLEFFYRDTASDAVKPVAPVKTAVPWGLIDDLPPDRNSRVGMERYLHAFLEVWNPKLGSGAEFRWQVVPADLSTSMIAVRFSTQFKAIPLPPPHVADTQPKWMQLLEDIGGRSAQPFISRRIYIDGLVRVITDTDILILKRNERRLWTASLAREDAEATMLQMMMRQQAVGETA